MQLRTFCLGLLALSLPLGDARAQGQVRVDPPPRGVRETCLPVPFAVPSYAYEVDLLPFAECGFVAHPFSIAWTEDGSRAYATLFGGIIGNSGCTVVRLDPSSLQVIGSITTGSGPEELAFVTFPDGTFRYGFVTDSSGSTVTVFDADDQVVATIPIPFDSQATFPTAFPFGLAVSPDRSRVYVSTLDGQGFVHAIDVETLSLDLGARIELGPGHGAGRLTFVERLLVLPATEFLPNFTGSVAKLCVVDPTFPNVVRSVELGRDESGLLFPSLQDVVVDCSGLVWTAGFDLGPRVFAIDVAGSSGPRIVDRIRTQTSQLDGNFQCLGLSPDGVLWAGDLLAAEIAWIDVRSRQWLGVFDADDIPTFFQAPNEVAFSPDGTRAAVVGAASENVIVFDL